MNLKDGNPGNWKNKCLLWLWEGLYISLKELKDEYKEYKTKTIFQKNADSIKNGFKDLFQSGKFVDSKNTNRKRRKKINEASETYFKKNKE